MGAVYRAEELALGRKVALKVIAPGLAQDDRFRERFPEDFLRESRIAASLDHPHVIPIYQAGDDGGVLFLAMRYVEGTATPVRLHRCVRRESRELSDHYRGPERGELVVRGVNLRQHVCKSRLPPGH